MQTIGFQDAVEKIRSTDPRYSAEAYHFLRDSLEATVKRKKKTRREGGASHISSAELLDGFRVKALQDFGPMSLTVLDHWGIRSSEDVGQMVFNLIGVGVFSRSEDDAIENFRGALDFDEAFGAPFRPAAQNLSAGASDTVPWKS